MTPKFLHRFPIVLIASLVIILCSFLYSCNQKKISSQTVNSIPNGNFENWDSLNYWIPEHALESSNPQTYVMCGGVFNCIRVTDAYHGKYAIRLTTRKGMRDNCAGYFSNCHLNGHAPTWLGGVPYNQKPSGIQGYYKSSIREGDSGLILLNFRKAGKCIGYYELKLNGFHSDYLPFSFAFNPPLKETPDTMMFAAVSNDVIDSLAVSTPDSWLQLDQLLFLDVSQQPKMFDGDFEHWQYETLLLPQQWHFQSGLGEEIFKTSDAYIGNYAMGLRTFKGDDNGTPVTVPGGMINGAWKEKCSCYAIGYPFNNPIDTLTFYYKYLPALPTDSAAVNLIFRKNGMDLFSITKKLGASSNYQYAQVPFQLPQEPDSVGLQIVSSQWTDVSLDHLGSVLKIDEIHFKSQVLSTTTAK